MITIVALLCSTQIFSQSRNQKTSYRVITLQDRGKNVRDAHYNFHTRGIVRMKNTYCKFKAQKAKAGYNAVNPSVVYYSCFIPKFCKVTDYAESQAFGRSDYALECARR